jgi:hypothetical protein
MRGKPKAGRRACSPETNFESAVRMRRKAGCAQSHGTQLRPNVRQVDPARREKTACVSWSIARDAALTGCRRLLRRQDGDRSSGDIGAEVRRRCSTSLQPVSINPTSTFSYQACAERFKAIFRAPETMPLLFIPGNRDVVSLWAVSTFLPQP